MEIKDYLHLYLGCECIMKDGNWKSTVTWSDLGYPHNVSALILRPLSSMTEEEYNHVWNVFNTTMPVLREDAKMEPILFFYLLSKGFDLFGLIDAGLAIDRVTTLKH